MILPLKVIRLKAFRTFGLSTFPINITVSITNKCNSRCKTCNIWKMDKKSESELNFAEFEKIFKSLGKAYWFTVSGGEPFLREDVADICRAISVHCTPKIINIPTNATLPEVIEKRTKEILQNIKKTNIIVNLSLDGVGPKHDEMRGRKKNFELFLETYKRLNELKGAFKNLKVGVHTVLSTYNLNELETIYNFVKGLKPDSHIFEVAEQRVELNTVGRGITPDPEDLSAVINNIMDAIQHDYIESGEFLIRLIHCFRLEYYDIIKRTLKEQRQIIPCYAGYASCQISPYGDVWACCIHCKSLGNLKDVDFDFKKVWLSEQADEIRKSIKSGDCYCPLANAMYTSMLCDFGSMRRVLTRLFKSYFPSP